MPRQGEQSIPEFFLSRTFSHIVNNQGHAESLAILQDVLEERGLTAAQKARENGDWQQAGLI